jgi:hypothetical protein
MCGCLGEKLEFVTLYTPEVKRPSPYVVVCLIAWVQASNRPDFAALSVPEYISDQLTSNDIL